MGTQGCPHQGHHAAKSALVHAGQSEKSSPRMTADPLLLPRGADRTAPAIWQSRGKLIPGLGSVQRSAAADPHLAVPGRIPGGAGLLRARHKNASPLHSVPWSRMLDVLAQEITNCRLCPRLREHCARIAEVKRRAYREFEYWGKPVPAFGDPLARVLVIGLAPGAHGSNRTGRMFTGDTSGCSLYRVLYQTGFASQPDSVSRDDGMKLTDLFITAAARCAPPGNKPTPQEIRNCRPFLERELDLLPNVKVVVALGKIAFDNYLDLLKERGVIPSRAGFLFGHDREFRLAPGQPALISSYHPSQQNTSTGRLTEKMLRDVFRRARRAADRLKPPTAS
jgi:uracil-DNA glycosylase